MTKSIAIISTYYPPENGAAANRISMMAEEFTVKGYKVLVLCPLPNYPDGKIFNSYVNKIYSKEVINGVNVLRLPIIPSNSLSGIKRFLSILSFAIPLIFVIPISTFRYNNILIQCPPLPTAMLSVLISKILFKNIIINISDLWPLSAYEMKVLKKGRLYNFLDSIANITYVYANRIICQSEEIISYVKSNYVKKPFFLYRNLQSKIEHISHGKFNGRIIYAGLIGHAQKISEIVKHCKFLGSFEIYGQGGDLPKLLENLNSINSNKIFYKGNITPKELSTIFPNFSYSLIPLTVRIYGAVPSKLYDSLARGVPVIFMGGGEGAEIVKKFSLGYVINPGDFGQLNNVLSNLNSNDYKVHYKNTITFSKNKLSFKKQFYNLIKFIENN